MDSKELVDTKPIAQLVDNIGAQSVFGAPTSENGTIIIPVAQVEYGFGYGGGYGVKPAEGESEEEADPDALQESTLDDGGGGGGGAGGRATPRGFIRITDNEVSYEPISNDERIPLAGILMIVWSVFWITMTIRTLIKSVAKVKESNQAQA